MASRTSAGVVLFRQTNDGQLEVLLVHPGGPFWASKDEGAWSIPKGEYATGEDPLSAAEREFAEEVGVALPSTKRISLGEIQQVGGKRVTAWAVRGDLDPGQATSNSFEIEWPPKSGHIETFPEVDRVAWFAVEQARVKLRKAQTPFLDRLEGVIRSELLP